METILKYTPKDFKSDQEVRWCAGCGDSAVLNAVQRAMAKMDRKKEDFAVISGIGCSSRFPYYMNTYGFHTIHGRAGVIATGVKVANPDLSVWQITGDGDALAIGGNHFIHEIRRNIDLNLVLLNNEIYGLTKGQYSPTSKYGTKTKTSPFGTVEKPFKPGQLVIGSNGHFFARSIDSNMKSMEEIFIDAENFRGTSVIEVLQNCVIFNDGAHDAINDKEHREDRQIHVKHGEKLVFGKNNEKGIVISGLKLKVVTIGQDGYTLDDVITHDAKESDPTLHLAISNMALPNFPVAFGVIRAVEDVTYDSAITKQIDAIKSQSKIKCMNDLLRSGSTWEVE